MPKLLRDPMYEREWLVQVARRAGIWGNDAERFATAVQTRLLKGAAEYGDTVRPVDEMLAEAAEECEDIPGWNILTSQLLNADDVDDDSRGEIQALILEAAAGAMQAWLKQRRAVHIYRVARAHRKHRRAVAAQELHLVLEDDDHEQDGEDERDASDGDPLVVAVAPNQRADDQADGGEEQSANPPGSD